jgi:methionyl-tRNA synthetase
LVTQQIEKLENCKKANLAENTAKEPEYSKVKEEITFDDFSKLDIRTGEIIDAVKVPKADKLLQLTVDLGFEKRTIVFWNCRTF